FRWSILVSSPHTISLLLLPGGDTQAAPSQTPALQRQVKGSSASMECRMSSQAIVHWYKHVPGEPPKRILYMSGQSPVFDNSGDERRFQVWKHPTELRYGLTIDYLTPRDSGIYYCPYKKGTLLSEPQALNSAKNSDTSLFHPSRHENQIMYVCLIEKFYPEVIRVTWADEADKEVTDNIVKGDVWKPTNGDKYSIGSWLTVPAENKDKNYYCKYEHESQQRSLSTQGIYYMLKIQFYMLL
uniref:Ig-like domain-containing protein n=1 Tax=Strix occidentalis caurina TaxID=311401 RepID=A0A8D0EWM9_STROC